MSCGIHANEECVAPRTIIEEKSEFGNNQGVNWEQ